MWVVCFKSRLFSWSCWAAQAQKGFFALEYSISLAPVVQKMDNAIHRINHYPLDSAIGFPNTSLVDSDLSGRYCYPTFEQLRPGVCRGLVKHNYWELKQQYESLNMLFSPQTNSQPMQEILGRMSVFDFVDIFVFPDDTILNVPVEKWPICDCLISFYSKGFPLEKAIDYANLRKPFSLNDLEMQYALMDRFVYLCCRSFMFRLKRLQPTLIFNFLCLLVFFKEGFLCPI